MKKIKVLAGVFLFAVMLAVLPEPFGITDVYADDGGDLGNGLSWAFASETGTISITKSDPSGTGEMTDYTSVSDAPWYTYADDITNVVIGEGVTYIAQNSFGSDNNTEYPQLTGVTFPANTGSSVSIGKQAFCKCTGLQSVTFPGNVGTIGKEAFSHINSLTTVKFCGTVGTVGESAFSYCGSSGLTVTFEDEVETIDQYAFSYGGDNGLVGVTFAKGVNSIGYQGFAYNRKLSGVTFGGNVGTIDKDAFHSCAALESVIFEGTVDTIGENAFSNNDALESLTFTGNVTTIGKDAFSYSDSLTTVKFCGTVGTVGESAFSYCGSSGLTVTFEDEVETIGQYAFSYGGDNGLVGVTFAKGVNSIGYQGFAYNQKLSGVTFGGNVGTIDQYAFATCKALESVTFNGTVGAIGKYAFSNSNYVLKNVTFGGTVGTIDEYAFGSCKGLENVEFGGDVGTIGNSAFHNCTSLESMAFRKVGPIGESAFGNCTNLASVTFGGTVDSIGEIAFFGCNKLARIEYSGNEAEWKAVRKGSNWDKYTPDDQVVYCKYSGDAVPDPQEGGSADVTVEITNNKTDDPTVTVIAVATAKDPYVFGNWTENGKVVSSKARYEFAAGSNLHLTANFRLRTYTVRFDKNADDATGTMEDQTFAFDVPQKLSPVGFRRNGYSFDGWKDDAGVLYADCASVMNLARSEGDTVILHAQWKELPPEPVKTYNVKVKIDGKGTAAASAKSATPGTKITIKATTDVKYRFTKWTATKGVKLANAGKATTTFKMPAKNVTVTAHFEKIYKVPEVSIETKDDDKLILAWWKVKEAKGYDIFISRCNHDGKEVKPRLTKTIKGNKTFKWTVTGLKPNKSYKAYVRAFITDKNGKKKYISKSPLMHIYTAGGTKKYTNAKSVKLNTKDGKIRKNKKDKMYTLTINVKDTYKIKASVQKEDDSKKLMPDSHVKKLRYFSSNENIASVDANGRITGRKKGSCSIYVYAHNGVNQTIKLTVK